MPALYENEGHTDLNLRRQMKAVIQECVYERGRRIFEASSIQWYISPARDEETLLSLQVKNQAKAIVIDSRPFTESFFERLADQSLIARFGTGYNNIPMETCLPKKILVANTPGALRSSAAEYVIGLLISLMRHIHLSHAEVLEGKWIREEGVELRGKTLGIIGFGAVGRQVAQMTKQAFGMRILAYGRQALKDNGISLFIDGYSYKDLRTFLAEVDVVSLHVPLTETTKGMMNKEAFEAMKNGSYLINTCRGGVVDEQALFQALSSQKLSGAALDVFVHEPYVPLKDMDLRSLPQVLMTPHLASHTDRANDQMATHTVQNITAFYEGNVQDICLVKECQDRSLSTHHSHKKS